jgi:8-oxo-dGTP diphosphatase
MEFKNRNNICYDTKCGKSIWHSRNVCVCVCIIRTNPDDQTRIQVLGAKRGQMGTHKGEWCLPCGYLDWSETIAQAAIREVYEETNLELKEEDLDFVDLDSDPNKEFQNVTVHFVSYYCGEDSFSNKNSEEGEIDSVCWFNFEDAEKLDWAFDHKERLRNLVRNV